MVRFCGQGHGGTANFLRARSLSPSAPLTFYPHFSIHNVTHREIRCRVVSPGRLWIIGSLGLMHFPRYGYGDVRLTLILRKGIFPQMGRRVQSSDRRLRRSVSILAPVWVLALVPIRALGLFALTDGGSDAHTANTTLTLDISLNSPKATIDKNDASAGPLVNTLWAKVTNSGTSDAVNVSVQLGSFTNGLTLHTGQQSTYTIPVLSSGSSQAFFWFVNYSTANGTVASYTITGDASNASEVFDSSTITTTKAGANQSSKVTSVTASTAPSARDRSLLSPYLSTLGKILTKHCYSRRRIPASTRRSCAWSPPR